MHTRSLPFRRLVEELQPERDKGFQSAVSGDARLAENGRSYRVPATPQFFAEQNRHGKVRPDLFLNENSEGLDLVLDTAPDSL
jgi:hypothetical protein